MIVLIYIVVGLLGLYLLLRLGKRKENALPGPKGWPLVGIGFELTMENMFTKFAQYAQQYGPVFRIDVFGNTMVVLNSADLVRKAFTSAQYKTVMNDRPTSYAGENIFFNSKGISMHDYGSIHADLRKGFTRAMNIYGDGKKEFEELIQSELGRLVQKVESYGDQAFEFQDVIKRFLVNIIIIVNTGHTIETEENYQLMSEFERTSDFFSRKVDALMKMFPVLRHIPCTYKTRYQEMVNARNALTKMYYHEAKATFKPGVTRGMVDVMVEEQIRSQENGEDVIYTDEQIMASLLETLVAGVFTTLSHLSSIFICLMNHPEYQAKLQEEIDHVIGTDRLPVLDDKKWCPLIEAVSLEAHRLLTVVPGSVPHLCNANVEFEGYDLPRKSMIIPNLFYIHHDENIWGDPWTFRPDRWFDENGDLLPNDHIFRKSWFAFGTGRRQCIGEPFARSRVFLTVATFLQRWTFKLPPGSDISCDPRSGSCEWNSIFRMKAYHCRVVRRQSK